MYYKVEEKIAELYNQVEIFNTIAENLTDVTPASLKAQAEFIQEELNETFLALEEYDEEGVIDAIADVFVTVAGLMQKAEAAGFDVAEAIRRVNVNNLSKYPPYAVVTEAKGGMGESRYNVTYNDYAKTIQPPNTIALFNERFSVVVFKDHETMKVKKPLNFQPVDLTGTYPVGFLKGVA